MPITPDGDAGAEAIEVTIRAGPRRVTVRHRPGETLLETARFAGLRAPSVCRDGICATCTARIRQGKAVMRNNEALTAEEVADGWVLTCQAIPVSATLHLEYDN